MNTTALVTSPNINGNIGSCEVKTTDISIDSWNTQTIAVNSCTGQIVAQNTYFSWGIVLFAFGAFIFIALFVRMIID